MTVAPILYNDVIMIRSSVKHQFLVKEEEYFPWNDGIDYSSFCMNLQRTFKSFEGPVIVFDGFGGGLGHKFVSIVNSMLLALLLKRPFYCNYYQPLIISENDK